MQKKKKFDFWILFGPCFLLLAFSLLFFRSAALLGHPFWIGGLTLSTFLACGIVYLTYKELFLREKTLLSQLFLKEEEKDSLQSMFQEAQELNREKIEKFENTIQTIEEEMQSVKALREKAEKKGQADKSLASSLQTSLDDALDELRCSRQFLYVQQEVGKMLPKDLPNQYKQLRMQFDEKALILDQTRRRLFAIEGQLLSSKKEQMCEKLGANTEEDHLLESLSNLLEENKCLEEEIILLEAIIAGSPRTTSKEKKSKKQTDQTLELKF